MKSLLSRTLMGMHLMVFGIISQCVSAPAQIVPWHPINPPIIRPMPRPVLNQELQLISQKASVQIDGGAARTHLTQTFRNLTDRTIEGTYVFPLPAGAAVSGFAMTVGDRRVEAEILDGDKARTIYTGIVQQMRDPAILEFIDRNLIRARIFPIPARADQTVELTYSEALTPEGTSFRYVLPLRLPVGGSASQASVDINIHTPQGIRAVYSPTHAIAVSKDGNSAHVSGEYGEDRPFHPVNDSTGLVPNNADQAQGNGSDRDFVLYYTTAAGQVGVNLVTYRGQGDDDGYFMLLAAPDSTLAAHEIAAKDVVFVCDTSGSMEGEKIEQTRKALLTLLGDLNPDDRFNIISFASDVHPLNDGLVAATKAHIEEARQFAEEIKAVGGTDINDALQEALKPFGNDGRPHQIIFMTDGEPTVGETDVSQILKNVREANAEKIAARLFVFGVGYDVNTRLLDTLAQENRGSSDYVLPEENIEAKVGSLYSKIAYPVLSNPSIDWGGMKVFDVYPKRMPDLFRGTQAVLFGRYSGQGDAHIQLIGTSQGEERHIGAAGTFAGDNQRNDTLPRLWAMRKIGYLIDDSRRSGNAMNEEVKAEIIQLSKKYGIVTPLTAALVTDDSTQPGRIQPIDPVIMGHSGGVNGPTASATARGANVAGAFGGASGYTMDSRVFDAPAPTNGADAVMKARTTKKLRDVERDEGGDSSRYLDGKAFFLRNGVWTDATYEAGKSPAPETIKFGSDAYFALLKDPQVAKWLSVGDHVILVLKGKTVEIVP